MERSETWLAGIMRTSRGAGTSPSAFANVLRMLRVKFAAVEDAAIQDIERFVSNGLPVLVAWTLHGDGHYSVVTKVNGAELSMVEPFDGKIIKVNRRRFLRLCHDPCNQTTRWMMVVGDDGRMGTV